MAPSYTACTGDVAHHRDAVIAVWHDSLGLASRHAGKFDWFYLHSPFGKPLLQLLRHEPSHAWVGSCAIGPRRMTWEGRDIRAGVVVDMAVDARHRTLGPAMILQDALLTAAHGRFDLLYGFPNRKALPVVKRLGYSVLGGIPRFSRVLRHARYFKRHLPHWLAQPGGWLMDALRDAGCALQALRGPRPCAIWSEQVDPRMDALWHGSRHGHGPIAVRDTTFLRWRFDQSPTGGARYLLLGQQPDGPLLAWFACQTEGDTLLVRDFWSVDASEGVGRPWIQALIRSARREGHAAIALEYAAPARKLANWLDAGFVEREQRPIIGKWLQGGPDGRPEPVEWHLTAADEDE